MTPAGMRVGFEQPPNAVASLIGLMRHCRPTTRPETWSHGPRTTGKRSRMERCGQRAAKCLEHPDPARQRPPGRPFVAQDARLPPPRVVRPPNHPQARDGYPGIRTFGGAKRDAPLPTRGRRTHPAGRRGPAGTPAGGGPPHLPRRNRLRASVNRRGRGHP